MGQKNVVRPKNLDLKKVWVQKKIVKKIQIPKKFGIKKFGSKKIWVKKKFGPEKFWV